MHSKRDQFNTIPRESKVRTHPLCYTKQNNNSKKMQQTKRDGLPVRKLQYAGQTKWERMWPLATMLKTWCSPCDRLTEYCLQQARFARRPVLLRHRLILTRMAGQPPADLAADHVPATHPGCSSPPGQQVNGSLYLLLRRKSQSLV